MKNDNVFDFTKPEQIDPLQKLLRDDAGKRDISRCYVTKIDSPRGESI